jgi:putative FmdB family regulatory protein
MPTYDYRCTKCKHVFELFHSITDDAPKRCPRCKAKAVRIPTAGAGLLFKGSGFYITDYRSKSYKDKARQDATSTKSDSASKSDSGSKGETSARASSSSEGGKKKRKSEGGAKGE